MNALCLITRGYVCEQVTLTGAVVVAPPQVQTHRMVPKFMPDIHSNPKVLVDGRTLKPTIKKKPRKP